MLVSQFETVLKKLWMGLKIGETIELLLELEKFEEFLNELTITPTIDISIKKTKNSTTTKAKYWQ